MCIGNLNVDLTKLSCCPEYWARFIFYQLLVFFFFYLCLKGLCISFRLLNTRGLVLKSKTTVVEYRARSPGEFRTLKTCLVFVLKGLDSIFLNKSCNCSLCFVMFFFLLRELDMNEGDLRVCLVSPLKQSHEGTCPPFLKQSRISSWEEPFSTNTHPYLVAQNLGAAMGELSKPLLLHPRGSAFILHQAHFYLPRQLYPAGCPHGHRRIWRGGIGILSHQLWNHGSLPAKQAFDKYLTCYFIFRAGEDSHLFVGSATSGCLHLFMDVCYPDDWHIRGATERDSFL